MTTQAQPGTAATKTQPREGWPLLAVALTMVATPACAGVFTAPTGLAPGSSYRLMFITSDATTATSTSIADYNSFAGSEAALNPLLPTTTWAAIGSTATTGAIANTDGGSTTGSAYTNDPIFMVNGSEVTSSLENFFASAAYFTANGPSSLIINPLTQDENGNQIGGGYVWTGSNADGTAAPDAQLGSSYPLVWVFNSDGSPEPVGQFPGTALLPMIAISAPILAPSPVPEPASGGLLAAGVGMLGLLGWRRRRAA